MGSVIDFPQFSCHMQALERVVKLMTESAPNVCSSTAKEGYIRVKINSHVNIPKFNTKGKKKQFNVAVK